MAIRPGARWLWLLGALLLAVLVAGALQAPAPPTTAVQLERARDLQDAPAWLLGLLHAVTFLGDEEFYLLVFPLLYWSVSRRVGLRLGTILLLTSGVNALGKLLVASPRPPFFDSSLERVTGDTFGIPSGHAQNAGRVGPARGGGAPVVGDRGRGAPGRGDRVVAQAVGRRPGPGRCGRLAGAARARPPAVHPAAGPALPVAGHAGRGRGHRCQQRRHPLRRRWPGSSSGWWCCVPVAASTVAGRCSGGWGA